MLIEEQPLQHWITNFYGYGSWRAKLWFIAHEEGGGDLPEEVAEKINFFQAAHAADQPALCDIREVYTRVAIRWDGPKAGLFANFYEYRFGANAIPHGVWKNLIAFAHGYRNKPIPDILAYQRHAFASSSLNDEALIRLYPLPAPHNHGWYYSWLDMPGLPFLKSRSLYQQHVYANRIAQILTNIREYKPELVLMYGMENINTLKASVQEFFPGAKFKMMKAVKLQIPQHHVAELNGTRLLITTQIPALRHGRIETGFAWEEFGRSVVY